jgi:phytoene dehydrogenase-like protein
MDKSLIIIGAGIAGLSTGCYAQMNGYDSQIFEMHDKPGGVCTSWKRNGYTFDGCIDWLMGTRPESMFHQIWQELGALQGRPIINHDELMRIETTSGKALTIYANVDRLEQHLKEVAPLDAGMIGEFCLVIRQLSQEDGLQRFLMGAGSDVPPWTRGTFQEFAARLQDPFLREAFLQGFASMGTLVFLLMYLALQNTQSAGYPLGGSLEFARAIERHYIRLGGEIHYGARVEHILVEHDRAVGIRLYNGIEHRADRVISAADGHATIFDMLEGKYLDDEIRNYYATWPVFPPLIQVSLGVARDFSSEPPHISLSLREPISIGGVPLNHLDLKHYCYDPTMAPPGKSVLVLWIGSDLAYWEKIAANHERYEKVKREIAETIIAQLEKRFPGLTGQVEAVDVATPLTYERYDGLWRAAYEGWLATSETFGSPMRTTLPGLQNFSMVGQWVSPGGGLPPVAQTGRTMIQTLCEQDGRSFTIQIPATPEIAQQQTARGQAPAYSPAPD